MIKQWMTMALALILCLTLTVAGVARQEIPHLSDAADLLDASEEQLLQSRMVEIGDTYNVEIAIATVPTVGDTTVAAYAESYYRENSIGYGESDDGVLLLVAMQESECYIFCDGLGQDAISLEDIEWIFDAFVSSVSDGDYAQAFHTFIDECEYEINGEINGFPFGFFENLLISLVIGLVAAFIVTAVMKGQLKSVRRQPAATEYTKEGSMQVTQSSDMFLYRTVSRIRKPKPNSSSGRSSGSSGHGAGRKF